ncbi:uncharacterized protein LOC130055003 [Ostrea edulis]|uniref:uncharacterized protein LOC130055003 n=1 Tax=Ostrea edulis TaxID=37623 RepID=UPI0024AEF552|nr:uncharacterized protein LOC130055003 [Ostrea edulis]
MEDKFLYPGSRRIPQSYREFYSIYQTDMQQQDPSTQTYSTPPAITFQGDQSNSSSQSQTNETATQPSSSHFFNQRQTIPIFSQLQDVLVEECLQTSIPSTMIQTMTEDYNNNAHSVSYQQNKSYPATQSNYTACSQPQSQKSPTNSHLHVFRKSASSEQEMDSEINIESSLLFQGDNGVDLLKQATYLSGITAEDVAAFLNDTSSPSVSPEAYPPATALAPVHHELDTALFETAFTSTNLSHSSLSDVSPIRGEENMATPEGIHQSNPLKRIREDEKNTGSKRGRMDSI